MKKAKIGFAIGLVLVCSGLVKAQTVGSDNFNDGTYNPQWVQGADMEVLGVEQNGVMDVSQGWYSSGAGSMQKGIETDAGYVLSGAFDIQIDGKVNGGISYYGKEVKLELQLRDVNASASTLFAIAYRTVDADNYKPVALMYDNGVYQGAASLTTDYTDHAFQFRVTRDEEGLVDIYSRELGVSTWDLVTSYSNWSMGDLKIMLQSSILKSGGSINGYFDNLVLDGVPQPDLLPGDANHDGVVSAGDYAAIQSCWGNTGNPGILGDANLDGIVSGSDYASVQLNFGNVMPSATGAVPEPITLSVLALGGLGLIRRKQK